MGEDANLQANGGGEKPIVTVPSPFLRLLAGLTVILSVFVVFAFYTVQQVQWLEDFQVNVVQRNRKASLQLLRLQNDANLLGISLRDMTVEKAPYPISAWRSEFDRLRGDMEDALVRESADAPNDLGTTAKLNELRGVLETFWKQAGQVFDAARRGHEAEARASAQYDLEQQRKIISGIVARLFVYNDQAQVRAAQRIEKVYSGFKRDNLLVLAVLFLIALATGLYTLGASRATFSKLSLQATQLQAQSEHLRRLSWKLIDVQEGTLREVAHDLHDEFGQILTAVGIMLNRVTQKASADPALLDEVKTVKNLVEETLQSVRDRSQMFRPGMLDDFGLVRTLEWFALQFSRQTGITVNIEGNFGDVHVPAQDGIHIYRIVQEALSNVARHSKATEAQVRLAHSDGELTIEVHDDGEGFQPLQQMDRASGEGFGLMGMRERARRLHGALTIQSEAGQGATIAARIPLQKGWLETAAGEVKKL